MSFRGFAEVVPFATRAIMNEDSQDKKTTRRARYRARLVMCPTRYVFARGVAWIRLNYRTDRRMPADLLVLVLVPASERCCSNSHRMGRPLPVDS